MEMLIQWYFGIGAVISVGLFISHLISAELDVGLKGEDFSIKLSVYLIIIGAYLSIIAFWLPLLFNTKSIVRGAFRKLGHKRIWSN